MIVVKVELWSAVTGQQSEIARMWIDNIGGTQTKGDYRARTLRGRSAEALAKRQPAFQREGRVLGHARLKDHVWNLVAKALSSMGYGAPDEPRIPEDPVRLSLAGFIAENESFTTPEAVNALAMPGVPLSRVVTTLKSLGCAHMKQPPVDGVSRRTWLAPLGGAQ